MTSPTPPKDEPPKKQINLLRGWPAPSLLPAPLLHHAASTLLSSPALYVPALQYGPDPGYQPLREALATWLGASYNSPDTPDEICITGGASQGVACILDSFTDVGVTRGVWVVEPGYFLVGGIIRDAGLGGVMRGVREDDGGIDVGALADGMRWVDEEWEAREALHGKTTPFKPHLLTTHRKPYRHLIYLVPTLNNPSSTTLSLPRRTALVTLARAHDALCICDDVYDFLQWPVTPPSPGGPIPLPPLLPRLSTIDIALGPSAFDPPGSRFGHALSNGTFSKLVGPGVRTGWVHAAKGLVDGLAHTGASRSGGAPSQVGAAVLCRIVEDGGLGRWLESVVRPGLRGRWEGMKGVVGRELRGLGEVVEGGGGGMYGGYFLWVRLGEGGPGAGEVAREARGEGVVVAEGGLFAVGGEGPEGGGGGLDRYLRLCFSWEDEGDLVEGVKRLGRVLRRLKEGGSGGQSGGGVGGVGEFV